jgi:hypothetical protein
MTWNEVTTSKESSGKGSGASSTGEIFWKSRLSALYRSRA